MKEAPTAASKATWGLLAVRLRSAGYTVPEILAQGQDVVLDPTGFQRPFFAHMSAGDAPVELDRLHCFFPPPKMLPSATRMIAIRTQTAIVPAVDV
jgi:hypothetical protein